MTEQMNTELKKMLENHLVLLLDASGSMNLKKEKTIEAVNGYVENLKSLDNVEFTLILWDSNRYTIWYKGSIQYAPTFVIDRYLCLGATPLYDVIGRTLKELQIKDGKKFLTVMTDGMENDSKTYSLEEIKKMISKFEEEGNVAYFLGEGLPEKEVYATMRDLGINQGVSYNYNQSSGTFNRLAMETSSYFTGTSTNKKETTE